MSSALKPILVIPAREPGRGGGHLTRCMALVSGLRALGRDAWLFADRLVDTVHFDRGWLIDESRIPDMQWECVVLDRFQTPPEELERWRKLAPVIGIDEGGVSRNYFDFLVDILPGCYRSGANIADVSLLPLPEKIVSRRDLTEDCCPADSLEFHGGHGGKKRVLVSFGQEDAAGLGFAVARALAENNDGSMEISLLQGGLGNKEEIENVSIEFVQILLTIPDLVNRLTDYDLVITHYGLTAFEALYMGVPVLLVSPSSLHEKLAKAAGFYSLGVGKAAIKKLKQLLKHNFTTNQHEPTRTTVSIRSTSSCSSCGSWLFKSLDQLKDHCAALAAKYSLDRAPRQSFAELINGFAPDVSRNCPACGAVLHSAALDRYAERTYRRCARCGIIAMNRLTPPPVEYSKEYFFELYQKQYGKTYIEDFPNLTAMAKRRLAVIKNLFQNSLSRRTRRSRRTRGGKEDFKASQVTPRLLDIGCAYGPFLAAARDEGFSPFGIDPAEDAVRYVTETLGIPAMQGFFPDPRSPIPDPYSVITLWYVIEHFRDCVPVLAEIRKRLKPRGVFAFATPSFAGVSGRASLKKFLERSPADHWTVWSPAVAKKALKAAGFTVKKIINSGHHPERFPLLGKFARGRKSPLYWPLLAASKVFSLGDTFEVYAARV